MKNIFARLTFICVMAVAIASPAFAQDKEQTPDISKFPVLQKLKEQNGGEDLQFDYVGKYYNIDAWLISGTKIMQMVYLPENGNAAIVGGAFVSPEGLELNDQIQRDFAANHSARAQEIVARVKASIADPQKAEAPVAAAAQPVPPVASETKDSGSSALWTRMEQLGIIHFGATENVPIVYAVLDANDSVSKEAWVKLIPLAEVNKIDLRVVPITLSSADRIMETANMLGSTDPQKVWIDMLKGVKAPDPETRNPEGAMKLKLNADFVEALRLTKLPSFIYRANETAPIRLIKGTPKDWNTLLNEWGIQG